MKSVQKKDTKNLDQIYMNEINQKLHVMKQSQFRSTNFSLIEYFADNKFKPLIQEILIAKLLFDYKKNPNKYVLANDKGTFKSEKNFKSSISSSIARNKAFVKGPGPGELSLNLEKTLQYLNTMFNKYTNNSSNIHTPYKIFSSNKNSSTSIIKNIKKEKVKHELNHKADDVVNMEIEEQTKNKINNNHSYSIYYGQSGNIFKKENENNGIKSPISISNSTSYSFSNTNEKKNIKDVPEIFQQILFSDNLIDSIKTEKLSNILVDFNKFLSDVKAKKMNDKIEKEIENIKNLLQIEYDNKLSYDSHCLEIKNCQNEVLTIYKIMANQLKTLKIEINIKSYSYDVYVQLRDIIYKYEISYNNTIDIIKQKLEKIKQIVKELKDNRKYIYDCLNNVHKTIGFCDFNFSRLSRSIEQIMKINDISFDNSFDFDDDNANIKNIITKFKDERKAIIDEVNGIDKYIGNITID